MNRRIALACMMATMISLPAQAGDITETRQITPSQPDALDHFGHVVKLTPSLALVGMPFDDGIFTNRGSVYVFDRATGAELSVVAPGDPTSWMSFGWSIDMDGTTLIVGAPGDGASTGSAYLFDLSDPTAPVELNKLVAEDGEPERAFGKSVAISGGLAVIGSSQFSPGPSDSAYVFDVATGKQLHRLLVDGAPTPASFGMAVDIDGTTVIVGARNAIPYGTGAAWLFDAVTGTQIRELVPAALAEGDSFGDAVSLEGGIALIGASGDDEAANAAGAVYVFDANSGRVLSRFVASDGDEFDRFGKSIGFENGQAIIGSSGGFAYEFSAAYLFDLSVLTAPVQIARLVPENWSGDERFGHAVAISDGMALVGADLDDINGLQSGSAFLFDLTTVPCPADLDGSGDVGLNDLILVLAAWGPCAACPEDIDSDDTVGFTDLTALLAVWGDCE